MHERAVSSLICASNIIIAPCSRDFLSSMNAQNTIVVTFFLIRLHTNNLRSPPITLQSPPKITTNHLPITSPRSATWRIACTSISCTLTFHLCVCLLLLFLPVLLTRLFGNLCCWSLFSKVVFVSSGVSLFLSIAGSDFINVATIILEAGTYITIALLSPCISQSTRPRPSPRPSLLRRTVAIKLQRVN